MWVSSVNTGKFILFVAGRRDLAAFFFTFSYTFKFASLHSPFHGPSLRYSIASHITYIYKQQ